MKKINTLFAALLFGALLTVSSCSKEQSALDKLAGTWTYQTVKYVGTTTSYPASFIGVQTLYFSKCAAINTRCNGSIKVSGTTTEFQYDLNGAGNQAHVYNSDNSTDIYNITKLDKNNLVYTHNYNGSDIEFTLTK